MNRDAFFIPEADVSGQTICLTEPISAIHLIKKQDGHTSLGKISDLPVRTTVELCGDGFDERTVKVRADGECYFVFGQDLERREF